MIETMIKKIEIKIKRPPEKTSVIKLIMIALKNAICENTKNKSAIKIFLFLVLFVILYNLFNNHSFLIVLFIDELIFIICDINKPITSKGFIPFAFIFDSVFPSFIVIANPKTLSCSILELH